MRSLSLKMSIAAALLVALVANSVQAADGVVLQYKAKKGDKNYLSTTTDLKMTQNIAGMDLKTTFTTKIVTESEVIDPTKKGEFVVRQKSLKYIMKAEFPVIGKYEYDSTSSDNDSSGQISALLTPVNDAASGAVVDVTFSKLGKIVAIKGIQDVMKAVVDEHPEAAQFTGGSHTEDGAKTAYEEYYIPFPEKTLEDGDTWEKPLAMTLPSVGKFTGKTVYKYEGTETVKGRELHKITYTTDMSIEVNQKTGGAVVTGTLEVTASTGTALFDLEKAPSFHAKTKSPSAAI